MMCFQALPIPNEYWAQNENVSLDNVGSFQDKLVESKNKYSFWTDDSPLTTLVTLQLVVAKWSGAMLTHQMH